VKRVEGALILAAAIAFGTMCRFLYLMWDYDRPGGGHDRYRAVYHRVKMG